MSSRASIGQELLNVPMGDMIREMAFAIADAQIRLDENSIEVAEMMGGLKQITDPATQEVTFTDSRVFFGQEVITLAAAAEVYETTNDGALRSKIVTEAGSDITFTGDGTEASPYTAVVASGKEAVEIKIPTRVSMLELGFTPTFYQFVDTIIEVKISIKYTEDRTTSRNVTGTSSTTSRSGVFGFLRKKKKRPRKNVSTTQVNASYAGKYSYSAEGSSLLRTKLAPIPAPAILEERIRDLIEVAEGTGNSASAS